MTFLSLFAGIGGLDLGLERAGMRCIGQVEIDPYCRAVLAKHWPDVPKWDDVRTFTKDCLNETPDLICGGFPCQDISNAGQQAGIDGERSGLWAEFYRLIRDLRPLYVLVENVSALLVRGLDRVLGNLAESGFDAEWRVFTAGELGAPHRRERVFIVAYSNQVRREPVFESALELPAVGRPQLWESFRTTEQRIWLASDCGLSGNADGLPNAVDRIGACGNAVVPQVAEVIGRAIMQANGGLA